MFKHRILLFIIYLITLFSCIEGNSELKTGESKTYTVKPSEQNKISKQIIHYSLIPLHEGYLPKTRSSNSEDSLRIILFLNRTDKKHLLKQDSIIIPDTFISDFNIYSPFPSNIKELNSIHKILFFSYHDQTFVAYERGVRKRWGAISMGKETTRTPTGLLHTNWKSKETISTVNKQWVMKWYFNLDNFKGVSMHQFELPGYPASHACIRLTNDDAYWLYYWADQWILETKSKIAAFGTPVIIYGNYPFKENKPWVTLAKKKSALIITKNELTKQVMIFLDLIIHRQNQRDSIHSLNKE